MAEQKGLEEEREKKMANNGEPSVRCQIKAGSQEDSQLCLQLLANQLGWRGRERAANRA